MQASTVEGKRYQRFQALQGPNHDGSNHQDANKTTRRSLAEMRRKQRGPSATRDSKILPILSRSAASPLVVLACMSVFVARGTAQSPRPQAFAVPPVPLTAAPPAPAYLRPPLLVAPPPPHLVPVAGNGALLRQADRVDQIIMPHDNFTFPGTMDQFIATNSYVIDHKRFVEPYSTRCLSSTVLEDPDLFEPSFVIVKPGSERRLNATAPTELIRMAGFEAHKRTTIFIHGFTQSYPDSDWLRKIRALFERHSLVGGHNLIIMDWGVASHGSYSQVAARVSAMGSFLANFLMKLTELGADRLSFHLIGHSLGAHVAGFAGKRIRPLKLGRITALDAAGPCFGKLFSNSPTDRLSPDDAYEVDVYHYDDVFLGLPGQHGHWDVYVNGGSSQPGCKDNMNAMFQAIITMVFRRKRVLSESHTRSTEVASSPLTNTACQQVAYECRDWPAFIAGECGQCDELNSQCFFMGFPFQYENMGPLPLRQQWPGKRLFIATSSNEYYCLQHYQILVRFELSTELAKEAKKNRWRVQLELIDDRGDRSNATVVNQLAPNVFSYLYLTERRPARIVSALMQVRNSADNSVVALREQQFKQQSIYHQPGATKPPIKVNTIEINFMSDINPQARRAISSRLCPRGWVPSISSNNIRRLGTDDNLISVDPQDDWLAFDECNRRFY